MKAACILPVMVTVVGFITTLVGALAMFAFQTVCFQRPAVSEKWVEKAHICIHFLFKNKQVWAEKIWNKQKTSKT